MKNTKDYINKYMIDYRKNSSEIECDICFKKIKKCYYYHHIKSKNHTNTLNFLDSFKFCL
jgi:hypothetical protein